MSVGKPRDPAAFIRSNAINERTSHLGSLDGGNNALLVALGDTMPTIPRAERSGHAISLSCGSLMRGRCT